jgi:2-polyprenyl-3-methyl-5-hydroxy-6-metoxy-1,4-benzoquinol methylase
VNAKPLLRSVIVLKIRRIIMAVNMWDERYAGGEYFFGTRPNAFLVSQQHLLKPGMSCLAVADGEGRNGVWLVEQGLKVLSVDSSAVAASKADTLAQQRGVKLDFEVADLLNWEWGENRYDAVVAIFIQFATPEQRTQLFANMKKCLKPGGRCCCRATPRASWNTAPAFPVAENMYTEPLLQGLADMDILHPLEHDGEISEGEDITACRP